MSAPTRVLPADVYDALELSALAYGGIGAGDFWQGGCDGAPHCAIGHAWHVDPGVRYGVALTLRDSGITVETNDAAFDGLNVYAAQVPFAEWCRRLNVVRADEPTYDAEFVAHCESLQGSRSTKKGVRRG